MQELFGKAKSIISEHISNVFKEGELLEEQVVRKFLKSTQHAFNKGITPNYPRYLER